MLVGSVHQKTIIKSLLTESANMESQHRNHFGHRAVRRNRDLYENTVHIIIDSHYYMQTHIIIETILIITQYIL